MSFVTPVLSSLPVRLEPLQSPSGSAAQSTDSSFGSTLQHAVKDVNALQQDAAKQTQEFALGTSRDVHSVMIASQKATIALELTTQVRNKMLEAYQEIMRMPM